jgi:hypothetical protein
MLRRVKRSKIQVVVPEEEEEEIFYTVGLQMSAYRKISYN